MCRLRIVGSNFGLRAIPASSWPLTPISLRIDGRSLFPNTTRITTISSTHHDAIFLDQHPQAAVVEAPCDRRILPIFRWGSGWIASGGHQVHAGVPQPLRVCQRSGRDFHQLFVVSPEPTSTDRPRLSLEELGKSRHRVAVCTCRDAGNQPSDRCAWIVFWGAVTHRAFHGLQRDYMVAKFRIARAFCVVLTCHAVVLSAS